MPTPLPHNRNVSRHPRPIGERSYPVASAMRPSWIARLLLAGFLVLPSLHAAPDPAIALPKSTDPRLEFTLVASEPQIVTPIGIAVDRRNRLFVVESHTHHRPENFAGPEADQVKVFRDTNGDGIPDTPKVFAEGFKSAMNLARSPKDELYLVHRRGVVLLHDADGDDVCERRTNIVELETTQDYPHNGLSGIVFGRDGWLYLGIGENFSAPSTLRGSDCSAVHKGPGRGGGEDRPMMGLKRDLAHLVSKPLT